MNSEKEDRYMRFVNAVFRIAANDKAASAKLRRADNANTVTQSWDILLRLGVDITELREMRAFSLIASAICKTKATQDGASGLGQALRATLKDNSNSGENEEFPIRLRRLLACTHQDELCGLLRPMLHMVISKNATPSSPIHFARLLKEVHWFGYNEESTLRTRLSWADGYHKKAD